MPGYPIRVRVDIICNVRLTDNSQVAYALDDLSLIAALNTPYQDLLFLNDDGTPSAYTYRNAQSVTGLVVTDGPRFLGGPADLATAQDIQFTVSGEYILPGAANAIVSFNETLTFQGDCGPRYVVRECVNAPPVRQQTAFATKQVVTQRGRAVGHTAYPPAQPPLWPSPILQTADNQITLEDPKRVGPNGFIDYPINWSYRYESLTPLVAAPALPPLF